MTLGKLTLSIWLPFPRTSYLSHLAILSIYSFHFISLVYFCYRASHSHFFISGPVSQWLVWWFSQDNQSFPLSTIFVSTGDHGILVVCFLFIFILFAPRASWAASLILFQVFSNLLLTFSIIHLTVIFQQATTSHDRQPRILTFQQNDERMLPRKNEETYMSTAFQYYTFCISKP